MGLIALVQRDGQSHGLGLGWLLAIALGGGVLLFTAIGLLLAWRLKARRGPVTTRVYSMSDMPTPQHSTHRLIKKRFFQTEQSLGALTSTYSSRLSLTNPPILPPLPTYNSFNLLARSPRRKGRPRSQSWVDEDEIHGPKVQRSARDSWFRRDSWFGRGPTLPQLDAEEGQGAGEVVDKRSLEEDRIEVQKRQSRGPLQQSQTAPAFYSREDAPRGRVRVPAQAHIPLSNTKNELKDILQSTEQRLRDGTSRSPSKTPRASPTRNSPTRTPQSYRGVMPTRTPGSDRTVRLTPSPSKRVGGSTLTPSAQSRKGSVGSVTRAANSLIAEAASELKLPGGAGSPSRMNGREWKPQEPSASNGQGGDGNADTLAYRRSMDSDASSSLSTLYSVGDPEEKKAEQQFNPEDPFVEKPGVRESASWAAAKQLAMNPHLFGRRSQTMAVGGVARHADSEAIPAPLRPISANVSAAYSNRVSVRDSLRRSVVLQPPNPNNRRSEEVEPKNGTPKFEGTMTRESSESSMVTDTVHSESDDGDLPALESPRDGVRGANHHSSSSPTASPSTPEKTVKTADASSSPFDEEDLLSLLLSSTKPKRALPVPPTRGTDTNGEAIGTMLSPRPKSSLRITRRRASDASDTSSIYDNESTIESPAAVRTGSPMRRPTVRFMTEGQEVGDTIAQLRRMNSIVSSYSVASMASTVLGDHDSPSIPNLRGGGFSPSRSQSKTSKVGSRNYLNISPKGKLGVPPSSSSGGQRKRTTTVAVAPLQDDDSGKENQGLGLKMPRPDSQPSGLRECRRSGNPDASARAKGKRLGPVEELAAEEQRVEQKRDSASTLGLYDQDGFLVGSPAQETKGRWLRM